VTDAQARAELLATLEALRQELDRAERIARRDPREAIAAALRANKTASRRLQSVALHSPR
jgi:prephenate dehydrogenase